MTQLSIQLERMRRTRKMKHIAFERHVDSPMLLTIVSVSLFIRTNLFPAIHGPQLRAVARIWRWCSCNCVLSVPNIRVQPFTDPSSKQLARGSSRFGVKPEGGQQFIFDLLSKSVGANVNFGGGG